MTNAQREEIIKQVLRERFHKKNLYGVYYRWSLDTAKGPDSISYVDEEGRLYIWLESSQKWICVSSIV